MTTTDFTYGQPLLQTQGINLALGGKQILRDLNLEVRNIVRPGKTQGQICAILGKSGAGKSTLFRILAGLQTPDTGSILLADRTSGLPQPVQTGRVGVIAQAYPLFDHRSAGSNLKIAGRIAGLNEEETQQRVEMLLGRFGLADKFDAWPAELSGGQRQRVAIAQQLMQKPMFLCMDEPFSGLDVVSKDVACDLIAEVASLDELMTIVVVSHDIESACRISDTVWLMGRDRDAKGEIVPGAYIKHQISLAERGLAWRGDVSGEAGFGQVVREIREKFREL